MRSQQIRGTPIQTNVFSGRYNWHVGMTSAGILDTGNSKYWFSSSKGKQEGRRVGRQINYWNRQCLGLLNYVRVKTNLTEG